MNNRIALIALPLVLAACAVATPVPTAAPTAAPTATRPPATAIPPAAAPTAAPTATAVPPTATPKPAPGTVTVMTHDSFAMSKAVLAAFEAETGITVKVLKAGDVGSALNKAILTKDAPLADVFYGVDNTFLSRALSAGIFDPYAAPALRSIADRYKLDPQNRLLPVDYGHVAVNYDKAWFEAKKLALPTTLKDLADPKYKGLLVVENPATSSPGLAFLLATIASFPEGSAYTWQQYWADLRKNDVRAAEGWEAAYYGDFSGSSGKGPRPLVVSYQTSPAAEVMFSEGKLSAPPTGNLDAAAFEQIEFVGILRGTKNRAAAERFVDFMLGPSVQADVAGQMVVYPVANGTKLPAEFVQFAPAPKNIVTLAPDAIDQGREKWIEAWTKIVLK